jgi:hypothetical protein
LITLTLPEPIIIAGDETKCKRAGNKVKRSRWVRDPLSLAFWFAAAKMPYCACPQTIRLSQGAFMLRKNSHPKMCAPMIAPGKNSTFHRRQMATGSPVPQLLNLQFKWWAVPTLRAREWLRYGACA